MWLIITVHIAILQWTHAQNLPTVPINNDYNAPPMDYNDYNTWTTVSIDYFNGKYYLYWTPENHCP